MKLIIRRICLLALVSVLVCSGVLVYAGQAKAAEKIYYTDLFYGYDSTYLNSRALQLHHKYIDDILFRVYNDYCDSDEFKWTAVKDGIKAATSLSEFYKLMSDTYGDTDYNFEDAMDKANVKLASELLKCSPNYAMADRVTEGMQAVQNICEIFEKDYNLAAMDPAQVFAVFLNLCQQYQIFLGLGDQAVQGVSSELADPLKADVILSYVSDEYEAIKTIAVGMMMENLRMEVIDDIIANAPADSYIYQGMTDLKHQLRNGFVSYFFDNYVTDKVMDEINDKAVSKLTEFALGNVAATFNAVSTLINVAAFVVFDVILDVPGVDDMTVQKVLEEYATDLYLVLVNTKIPKFDKQFASGDVGMYEAVFNTYLAASSAALKASKKLALDSNKAELEDVTLTWGDLSYDNYIEDIKQTIATENTQDRKLKIIDGWNVNNSTVFSAASDEVQDGVVYLFDGKFRANMNVTGDYTQKEDNLHIAGNLNVNGADMTMTVPAGKTLQVDGNVLVNWRQSGYSSYFSNFVLNGTLRVAGDFQTEYYSTYTPGEHARVYVAGDYSVHYNTQRSNSGTVIFNGTQQQAVNYLKATDVTVNNPRGIRYESTAYVYGHYALNGNPLDVGSYCTYMYSTTTFDNSDYILVRPQGTVTLGTDIKANVKVDIADAKLIVAEGTDYTIDGDLLVNWNSGTSYYTYYSDLQLDGTLRITGDFETGYYCRYTPGEASKLYVAGNYSVHDNSQKSKKGTVVFNGSQLQIANRVECSVLVLENTSEEGVQFDTVHVSQLFDHQGNVYTLSGSTSFPDYDSDGVLDMEDLRPTVHVGAVKENAVAIYQNGELLGVYFSLAEALEHYDAANAYLQLGADIWAGAQLQSDLYLDLNGYDLSGYLETGEYRVFVMDSSTDDFTCDQIGYFTCTSKIGRPVVPQFTWQTTQLVTGEPVSYVRIMENRAYTFHRYSLEVTHVSVKPNTVSLGYKAVFLADPMVKAHMDYFGFELWMVENHVVSRNMEGERFASGREVSLRVNNYDLDRYGEIPLHTRVVMSVDGQPLYSGEYTATMRQAVEAVNDHAENYSQEQLAAVKAMLELFQKPAQWRVQNILALIPAKES